MALCPELRVKNGGLNVRRPDIIKWHNTNLALRHVENLLLCSVCKDVMKNPYTYSTCYHHFCQGCISAECGLKCPVCSIPIWSKDLLPNYQLANVVMLVQHMKSLIVEGSESDVKVKNIAAENVMKLDDGACNVLHDHTLLIPPYTELLSERKGNSELLVKNLKPSVINSPIKQSKVDRQVLKAECNSTSDGMTDMGCQSLKASVPDGMSQPRAKRRRILSKHVHHNLDMKYPFSPVYTRTRSSKQKLLPVSNLTVLQHDEMRDVQQAHDYGCVENEQLLEPCDIASKLLKMPRRINHKGETLLHVLAIKGDVKGIEKFLQDGVDPNIKDYAGWTPLHEACNHGHLIVAELLIANGAIVNVPGYANCTPLHDAVLNGHLDIVKLLIDKGADPSIHNKYGKLPEDLIDDEEMRRTLHSKKAKSCPLMLLKSPHASPVLNGGPSKVVLLGTSLKSSHKSHLLRAAKLFNARICESFNADITHLVTPVENDCCPRTLKYLFAVAAAKWIVSVKWVVDSLSSNEWVDESFYEVKGCVTSTETIISEAPRKSRENYVQGAPGIFDGCQFYFCGSFMPPKASREELTYLVTLAGGTVLHREPKADDDGKGELLQWPYHLKGKHCTSNTFIVYDPSSKNIPFVSELNVLTVAASWILNCLSCFELKL